MVSTMADLIYGIQQSQPFDVFSYMKTNAPKLKLVGRTSYLPNLINQDDVGLSDGLDFVISGNVEYYDEVLMDGQTRRYAKIKAFLIQYSPTLSFSQSVDRIQQVEDGIVQLGYSDITVIDIMDNSVTLAGKLGVAPGRLGNEMRAAEEILIRAGVPSYVNNGESILDAPLNGENYIRRDGQWVLDDHNPHQDVNGGTATVN